MSFALDMSKFVKKAGNNAALVVKKVATDVQSNVVYRTPVDSGRARANWSITFNVPNTGTSLNVDKVGQATVSANTAKIGAWKDGDIWLTNNLPYIERLEYDAWSPQARAGMVRVTVREFQSYVNKAARGLK